MVSLVSNVLNSESLSTKALSYSIAPISFAVRIIMETHQYIEGCPLHSQGILKFAFGASVGALSLPFYILSARISIFAIKKIFGDQAFKSDSNRNKVLENLSPLYICVLGPIVEESLFRGILYEGTKMTIKFVVSLYYPAEIAARVGFITALIFSSLTFSFIHVDDKDSWTQNIPTMLNTALVGVVFSYQKEYSGFAMCLGDHIMNNTLCYFAFFIKKKFNNIESDTKTVS